MQMDREVHMRQQIQSVTMLHAGGLREGMLRPLEEECSAAGMASRPGTGMPAVPRSPIEQISTFSGHSISSELGQTDWRISPYETNPPSSEEETGEFSALRASWIVTHAPLHPLSVSYPEKHLWRPWGASAFDWAVQCMPAEPYFMGRTVWLACTGRGADCI